MNHVAQPRIFRAALWLLLVVLAISGVLLHLRLICRLDFDGENTPTESESLRGLWAVRAQQGLYLDFTVPPHVIALYPPLFYLVPGAVARWLDAGTVQTFTIGRWYTYLSWLAVGVVLYGLARQARCPRILAALAALLWWSGSLAPQWANSYRPDSTALLLSLAAIWVYQDSQRLIHTISTLLLLVAAFLTKQTAVVALLLLVADGVRNHRWRHAAILMGGWATLVGLTVAIAQALTQGAFLTNTLTSLGVFAGVRQVVILAGGALFLGFPPLSGGLLACVVPGRERHPSLLKPYFWLSLVLAFVLSTKVGGYVNYYLEPFAAGCVLSVTSLLTRQTAQDRRLAVWRRLGWLGLALGWTCYTLSVQITRVPSWIAEVADHRALRTQQGRAWEGMAQRLDLWGEPVLIEDLYLSVRRARIPIMLHAAQFATLQQWGKFDDSDWLHRIAQAQFTAIIASAPLEETDVRRQFPRRWTEVMFQHYSLAEEWLGEKDGARFFVYRPRNRVVQPADNGIREPTW